MSFQVWEGTAGIKSHSCLDLTAYKAEAIVIETSPFTRAISKGITNLTNSEVTISKAKQEAVAMGQVKEGCGYDLLHARSRRYLSILRKEGDSDWGRGQELPPRDGHSWMPGTGTWPEHSAGLSPKTRGRVF